MAYFKIQEPNQPTKWIKSIDRANGTLEFSTERDGCFQQDSGFFADSEFAYLKFHFTEAYPELEYMTIDTQWRRNNGDGGFNAAVYANVAQPHPIAEAPMEELDGLEMDAPNDPWGDLVQPNAVQQQAEPQVAIADANDLPNWN
jgi:hypothetical protein